MIDDEGFKRGMRCLAAGVNVITTRTSDGNRFGMTATAVCSVSSKPPTLLCCVNRQNSSLAAIAEAGVFGVNVLGIRDRDIANCFASPVAPDEKFKVGHWAEYVTGAPILDTALASFDCKVSNIISVSTHDVVFGEIQGVRSVEAAYGPLLYGHGAYGGFTSVALTEEAILDVLTSGASEQSDKVRGVAVSTLVQRDPDAMLDLQRALDLGVVDVIDRGGEQYLDMIDAQIVTLLGDFRVSGALDALGLGADELRKYVDVADSLSQKEMLVASQLLKVLDSSGLARLVQRGLGVSNLLLNALHTRAVLHKLKGRSRLNGGHGRENEASGD